MWQRLTAGEAREGAETDFPGLQTQAMVLCVPYYAGIRSYQMRRVGKVSLCAPLPAMPICMRHLMTKG